MGEEKKEKYFDESKARKYVLGKIALKKDQELNQAYLAVAEVYSLAKELEARKKNKSK